MEVSQNKKNNSIKKNERAKKTLDDVLLEQLNEPEDDINLFLNSLHGPIKKLKPENQEEIRFKITELLYDIQKKERLGNN